MRALAGLRHRLPLLLLAAGAAFVAVDSWIEARIALEQARETERLTAASGAERSAHSFRDPWFANPAHVKYYLLERRAAQRSTRIVGLLDPSGRFTECEPDSLRGASLDSLLGLPRRPDAGHWPPSSGADARLLKDQRVLAMSAPLAGPHSGARFVILVDPRARFAAIARGIHAQSLPGAALGIAIVVLIAWLLERWLHGPSRRLQQAAERIASGDLAARAGLDGSDEIASAGAAFDRMADAVQQMERELVAARARLDTVLQALPIGVGVVSREHPRWLYVNPRLRALTGLGESGDGDFSSEFRRLRIRRLDGTPVPQGDLAVARALATGQPATLSDAVFRRPDGEDVPFVSHAIPISLLDGEDFDAVVAVVQDRRELLRLSEEAHLWKHRFERVVAATGQVVYEWDLETGTVVSSSNRASVLGYDADGRDDVFTTWRSRLHPEDVERAQSAMAHCVRTGEPYDAEYRLRHGDGRWIAVHDRGFFDLDPAGRPVRMYGTMTDVSRQREVEGQLLQTQKIETVGTLGAASRTTSTTS